MLLLGLTVSLALGVVADPRSVTKIEWIGGSNVQWPCSNTKAIYKNSGKYVSKNVIVTRAAIYKDDALLALPRYRSGVPVTLGKVSLRGKNDQSSIKPFPCWSLQEEGNCAALQNVVDIFLDPRDILWALDDGIVNSLENPVRVCPPKVVAIDARTGKIVRTLDVSPLMTDASRLQFLVADYDNEDRVFVYISDATSRAILVFDVTSGRGYRLILPESTSLGCAQLDILFLSLLRCGDGGNRVVFTYLGSPHLYAVKSGYLQSGATRGRIVELANKQPGDVILGTDDASAVFFRRDGEADVYKWELGNCTTTTESQDVHRIYRGGEYILPTQVMPDYKRGRMRVLESNFPDFFRGNYGCGINHAIKLI